MPEDVGDEPKTDTVLSRKLKKVLDSKLEGDKDTMDALKELSTFFKENNLQNRRNLRGEIERRNLQITNDFLNAFQSVKETLDNVNRNVQGMSKSCANMQARLAASPNKNASRTYITSPLGMESEEFGSPPPEFLDPNANPVANDNDAYR